MMSVLELKIPPVLVTILFAGLMWLVSRLTPSFPLEIEFRISAFMIFAIAGTVVGLAGVATFKKANTTVNPLTPGACSSIVKGGIYRFSRNPMYLALLLALLGWGIFLHNFYSLALTAVFVVYLNRFQILPEERALEQVFGMEFLEYRQQVRRWL
jgi:protein-S-isoprenylcysteine O-methyltransferase Ste14